jgi:hypothetical protein
MTLSTVRVQYNICASCGHTLTPSVTYVNLDGYPVAVAVAVSVPLGVSAAALAIAVAVVVAVAVAADSTASLPFTVPAIAPPTINIRSNVSRIHHYADVSQGLCLGNVTIR